MRPSATRPTSFWRGESGPLLGLSDAPMCTAISEQGFLTRSRMRFGLVTTLARRGDGVIGSFTVLPWRSAVVGRRSRCYSRSEASRVRSDCVVLECD